MRNLVYERAVKSGVRRAKCVLTFLEVTDDTITLQVKAHAEDTVAVKGEEKLYRIYTPKQIEARVMRFCQHWALKQSVHFERLEE